MGRKNTTFHQRVPSDVMETARQMRHRVTTGLGYPNLNFGVFQNAGGQGGTNLKPARQGQTYYEGQSGQAQNGTRGAHRVVMLVNGNGSIEGQWYTMDHYRTFHQF
jgi:hypothetical protein